jgi:RNA polymerase sigma-70 factor (ECF subfamily)
MRKNDQSAEIAPTDAELVDRLRKGDETSFSTLYSRYFKRIYHFVDKRVATQADAEEITQEVFIVVFSNIESYRGEASFTAWVFGITRRVIAGRFKRKQHPTVPLAEDDQESAAQHARTARTRSDLPTPLDVCEGRERIAQLNATLQSRLNPEQRMLIHMHHIDEQPISEIASALHKSEDAVKSNLYRARKILLAR